MSATTSRRRDGDAGGASTTTRSVGPSMSGRSTRSVGPSRSTGGGGRQPRGARWLVNDLRSFRLRRIRSPITDGTLFGTQRCREVPPKWWDTATVTAPTERRRISPMRTFDPVRLGLHEADAWVTYYRREWRK